jgi:hypothetical protein
MAYSKYIMHLRDLVLFVKETGSNANQKSDPFRGIQKRIVGANKDGFGLSGTVNNNHCTVICFQKATEEPYMLAIIFKSNNKDRDVQLPGE